jgi:hypothetical protein
MAAYRVRGRLLQYDESKPPPEPEPETVAGRDGETLKKAAKGEEPEWLPP